jgi:PAS domain S-box-containing protein
MQYTAATNTRDPLSFERLKNRLLEDLPAGAYTCDAAGLITYFNQRAAEIWGRAPKLNDPIDRFCGSFKLYSGVGVPIAHDQCWMALALKTGRAYIGQEIIIERPDGQRVAVLAHASPVRDDAGQLLGAANVLVDITDRKRAEVAQAELAAIVESSDDAIVSKTLDSRIRSWNAGAERLFGYTAEEAIGQSIMLIIPPERQDEERLILARLVAGERIDHYETVRVSKSGRRLDISLTVSPIRDSAGRIIGASKVARDISQRKRADEALVVLKDELATQLSDMRRLHEMSVQLSRTVEIQPILEETLRTALAIEGAEMGLLLLSDTKDGQLKVGASIGLADGWLEEIRGLPLVAGDGGTAADRPRRTVVEDVESDQAFARQRDLARRVGFRAVHSTPLVTRAGKIAGVLATLFQRPHKPSDRETRLVDLCARQAVDFIENARLYAELLEADRRKDEFLAMLAHELRNPLAPVCNSLQLLRLTEDLPPMVESVREIMERQVDHMARLVDDLLDVSRIATGKIELRKKPVELASIVASAVEMSRPRIEAAGHHLAVSLPREPITLDADAMRLAQVVTNLLNNASKYMERGGRIRLTARRQGSDALLSVADTGIGIPADMLPRVFQMFAQADRSRDRSQGGLGIGLTLAKSIVELHGGRIEAHSDGPGKGSTFTIRLPAVAGQTGTPAAAGPAAEKSPTAARRFLVVDDARDSVFILSKMLELMGHQVRTTRDATAALEMVGSYRPEIVLSDISMPGMDGYELARRIRQQPHTQGMILVALTGFGQESDRQRAADAGFDYHLVKPVSLTDLRNLAATLPAPAAR